MNQSTFNHRYQDFMAERAREESWRRHQTRKQKLEKVDRFVVEKVLLFGFHYWKTSMVLVMLLPLFSYYTLYWSSGPSAGTPVLQFSSDRLFSLKKGDSPREVNLENKILNDFQAKIVRAGKDKIFEYKGLSSIDRVQEILSNKKSQRKIYQDAQAQQNALKQKQ